MTEVTPLILNKSRGGENTKDVASAGWRRFAGPVTFVAVLGVLGVTLAAPGGGGVGVSSTGGGGGRAVGLSALLGDAFSFSDTATERASPDRYADDPLFQEFRVQPKAERAVDDKSFLILSETNFAFAGMACNWIESVTKQIGEAAAKQAILLYVTGEKGKETKEILQSCSGGAIRGVFLRDAAAPSTAEHWGTKGYFTSTMRKPAHLFEAFQLAKSQGFQHMMFNDVDVAWKADLRQSLPRVDGFAAQNVEIGTPQVCSGVIIANVESEEARTIFQEWMDLTEVVLREGKMTQQNVLVYQDKTFCGDEDVLNALVLGAMPLKDEATRAEYGDASTIVQKEGLRTRRRAFQLLSPELVPNGRYARGADPKYADEDAANPILVDARYPDGAHFRALASAIHVNWCVGLERKVQHLMDYGLWFLNEEETERLLGIEPTLYASLRGESPAAAGAASLASPAASTTTPSSLTAPVAVSASPALLHSGGGGIEVGPYGQTVRGGEKGELGDEVSAAGCRVLFSTYPNSGTSWLEQLWSEASGVGAETVYTDHYPGQWQTPWKTTFDMNVMTTLDGADQLRVADHGRGECSMIKSHELPDWYQQVGSALKGDGQLPYLGEYNKVIVVRRNKGDNVAANLRFFQKVHPECAASLNDTDYFDLFAAREGLIYDRWHCGWQKMEDAGVAMLRVSYEDVIANTLKELRRVRNFLNFREITAEERLVESASKHPPLDGKDVSYPPHERLACDEDATLEALVAKVKEMTKIVKETYSCDSSMSWLLHSWEGDEGVVVQND